MGHLLYFAKYIAIAARGNYNHAMGTVRPIRSGAREPLEMHAQAMDNLRFIRRTMEGAASFTAVPGTGGMAMGATALIAAVVAAAQTTPERWLTVWLFEALAALAVGMVFARRKARTMDATLLSGPGRKFLLGLVPALVTGGLLTFVLFRSGFYGAIPAMWLLLYGTGVIAGGAFSVRIVPVMGTCFLVLGAASVFCPAPWGNYILALGFGVMQMVFGGIIAWRHGG